MSGLLFPKPTRKAKSKKRLRKRGKFKAHGDNALKSYRRKYSDYEVMARAEVCRQTRLRNPTEAELAFAEMLRAEGIEFDREKILQNGDRWVMLDAYVPSVKLAFELDGGYHAQQDGYDDGRDTWVEQEHGVKVIRFKNDDVLKRPEQTKAAVLAAIE